MRGLGLIYKFLTKQITSSKIDLYNFLVLHVMLSAANNLQWFEMDEAEFSRSRACSKCSKWPKKSQPIALGPFDQAYQPIVWRVERNVVQDYYAHTFLAGGIPTAGGQRF